jgi:hypothetical protein
MLNLHTHGTMLKMSGKEIGKDFLAQKVTLAGRPEKWSERQDSHLRVRAPEARA